MASGFQACKWRGLDSIGAALLASILAALAYYVLPFTLFAWSIPLAVLLSVLAIHDLRFWLLPNVLTWPLLALGLAYHLIMPFGAPLASAIGAIVGYALVAAINTVYRKRQGRDGMGYGDAKLLAGAGAWLGWWGLPGVLLIASFTALVHIGVKSLVFRHAVHRHSRIPFGPYLVFGFYVEWVFPIQYWL